MRDAGAFIAHVYRTVRDQDLDRLVDLFSDDCVFIDITESEPSQGRAAFRAYMVETFAGMPDFRPETWSFVVDGNRVGAELVLTGTHLGDFMGYPPTGRVIRWAASAFYTLSPTHDQVVREVYYYDRESLITKLASSDS